MLVEVSTLGEAIPAVREVADVRSLIGVDAQVVEEVVPLAEPLVTTLVLTLEDFVEALGLGVLVGKDTEALCVWDVLLDLDRVEIEGISRLYGNHHISGDLVECFTDASQLVCPYSELSFQRGKGALWKSCRNLV